MDTDKLDAGLEKEGLPCPGLSSAGLQICKFNGVSLYLQ